MCLRTNVSPKVRKELLKNITKDGMKVYKVVGAAFGKYYPLIKNKHMAFAKGQMKADDSVKIDFSDHLWGSRNSTYDSGFHFFTNRGTAESLLREIKKLRKTNSLNPSYTRKKCKIIECIVKKSWITKIGPDGITNKSNGMTIVAKKAIFP